MILKKLFGDGRQFIKFLIVGLSNTLLGYLIFISAFKLLKDIPYCTILSQILSYTVGMTWSYIWNRRWTFKQTSTAVHAEFIRFCTVQFSFMAFSSLLLHIAIDEMHLPPTLSWIGVMGLIAALNFLIIKKWVFKK